MSQSFKIFGHEYFQISLQNPEYEIFLRKVLYDAVILVEYSFLNLERAARLPTKHVKTLTIARLMVTHQAIELFRYEYIKLAFKF